ncbi:hypothetical protein [Hymenobacter crusticola]|uniref:Uncharacterized protein n=1 Tax=Hymenobacter crusticola TaxID=1770526 RepID=A0A243WHG3_9BACT|nr:hypothetical protein [Hymenobacter crusticola]OUJ74449.1 hypothetical protein BXP70_06585 [Hymenobacter crusticola]
MSGQGLEVFLDELATSKETVAQAASLGQVEKQDIVQITEQGHPWYAYLLIVIEVTPVGVKAYSPQLTGEESVQILAFQQFQCVGRAVITRP